MRMVEVFVVVPLSHIEHASRAREKRLVSRTRAGKNDDHVVHVAPMHTMRAPIKIIRRVAIRNTAPMSQIDVNELMKKCHKMAIDAAIKRERDENTEKNRILIEKIMFSGATGAFIMWLFMLK